MAVVYSQKWGQKWMYLNVSQQFFLKRVMDSETDIPRV